MTLQDIILVDEQDNEVGVSGKMEVHEKGLLHRAFSVFIFDSNGRLLLQQRAETKYHSPGLWTNTCCSHPRPGEETRQAASRRLKEEMGFETPLTEIFHFTYRASFENGLTEHEFDHVFAGEYEGEVFPDDVEVMNYQYLHLFKIRKMMEADPGAFTPWFLIAFPMVENWWAGKYRHLMA